MNSSLSRYVLSCVALAVPWLMSPVPAAAAPKNTSAGSAGASASKAGALPAKGPTKDECIDAYTRAQDTRRDSKLLAAREALLLCVSESCPKLVRTDCVKRLEELTPAVPSITFEVKDGAGRDVQAVTVTMDNQPFADHLDGSPIEIDPGPHTFVFKVQEEPPVSVSLVIHEGERGRQEPVIVGPALAAPLAPVAPPLPPVAPSEHRLGSQKVGALVVAGVGVAALAVGGVFGVLANSKKSDAQKICPDQCSDQRGVDKWSSARNAGNVSTVTFIVGAVAVGAGAVLWFTAKPESASAPGVALGAGLGSLQLRGSW